MPIAQVFHIKNLDRVIVVGMIAEGSVRLGDEVAVRTRFGTFPVAVEKLEHPKQQLAVVGAGQDVGLMLDGISKAQVQAGDVVVSLSAMRQDPFWLHVVTVSLESGINPEVALHAIGERCPTSRCS